jgi:hypothetical protein
MADTSEFKQHFIMVMVFLVILCVATGTAGYCAYKVGKSTGRAEGINEAYKLHPPVTMTGANPQMITNNNLRPKMNKFSIGLWPLHAGWCE